MPAALWNSRLSRPKFFSQTSRNLANEPRIDAAANPNSLAEDGLYPSKLGPNVGETFMANPSDKEIAARAYKLWEQNGQPEGRDEEFWRLAEQELLNDDKSSPMRTPDTL